MRAFIVGVVLFTIGAVPFTARAQDVQLPPMGDVLALDAGDRAPHAGMLIGDDDLVVWRQAIERLQFQLQSERTVAAAVLEHKLAEERLRTAAATETLALHDRMWTDRVADLSRQLATAREHQGPAWYEQPGLWFGLGVLATVIAVVAAAALVK